MTPALRPVLRSLFHSFQWLLWIAMMVGAAAVLIGLGIIVLGGEVHQSIWEHAGTSIRWMLFVVGIVITPLFLPPYVAHGITRRTFTAAAGLAALLMAAATAGYLAAGYLVERAAFAAIDRPHTLGREHLFGSTGQVHLVVVEYALVNSAYLVGGWLIGSGYYRFGAVGGTLVAPLGFVPIIGVAVALGNERWSRLGSGGLAAAWGDPPVVAALGAAVAVLVLGGMAVRALTRAIPLRSTTS